jgi:16S rRNA G966 N2-methylase RsmD
MIQAMALQRGERVLDCTMGMGTDAIVASHIVGAEGNVTAVESETAIYHLVKYGLATYELPGHPYLTESMRRIHTVHDESLEYLKQVPDHTFHIVYFDPMFRVPVKRSSGIAAIRELSNANPLTIDHIDQAKRVSQRAVVMKERPSSAEFQRLGFTELPSTRGASVAYGVIRSSLGGG